jgi:hypothetical protein
MSQLATLDAEIAQAECRAAEAFDALRAHEGSTSEAIAQNRVVKALNEKLAALKSRRFEVVAGIDAPPALPQSTPRNPDVDIAAVVAKAIGRASAEVVSKAQRDMETHVAAACAAVREEMEAKLAKEVDLVKWGLNHTVDQKLGRSAGELLKHREIREATQAELRLQLLDVRKEVLELREALAELRALLTGSPHGR